MWNLFTCIHIEFLRLKERNIFQKIDSNRNLYYYTFIGLLTPYEINYFDLLQTRKTDTGKQNVSYK